MDLDKIGAAVQLKLLVGGEGSKHTAAPILSNFILAVK